jgi:hypothetical protein
MDIDKQLESANAPEDDEKDDVPDALPINRNIFTHDQNGIKGFSVIPLWVVYEMAHVQAHHAIPLVAAILWRMRTKGINAVLITSMIWKKTSLDDCINDKSARQVALQHLRRVPGIIRLEDHHTREARYQATLGETWIAIEGPFQKVRMAKKGVKKGRR